MASSFSALFLYLMGIVQVWGETPAQERTFLDKEASEKHEQPLKELWLIRKGENNNKKTMSKDTLIKM